MNTSNHSLSVLALSVAALISSVCISCSNGSAQEGAKESTTDTLLQEVCKESLADGLKDLHDFFGQVIVMECATGKIRAMIGLSDKENGCFTEGDSSAYMCSASFMGFASTLACLETCKVDSDAIIDTGDGIKVVRGDTIKDYKWYIGGFHCIDMRNALLLHSSLYTCLLVDSVFGSDTQGLYDKLTDIGYGLPDSTGFMDIRPVEYTEKDNPRSCLGDFHRIAPIQTLAFFNSIANNGTMVKPTLTETETPEILKNPTLSQKSLQLAKAVMCDSTYHNSNAISGTFSIPSYRTIAYDKKIISILRYAYFPADAPKYAMLVALNFNKKQYSGSTLPDVKIIRQIADYLYK